MAETTPCSQCGTLVASDVEFCPNCNFYMSWAKDPEDEESAARSPRLPDEEVVPKPTPPPEPLVESGDPCPQCETPNAPARVFCRRCGQDLRKEEETPAPVPVDRGRPPWLVPVLVVVGVAVILALWVALSGGEDEPVAAETTLGPAESVTTTTVAPTTETTAPPVVVAVLPAEQISVTASSSLPGDAYAPANLIDGSLETAWNHCGTGCDVTGDARQGVGVTLRFGFDGEVTLTGFRIANGYQKESETIGDIWVKNNRIQEVFITTSGGSETLQVADERGFQTVEIQPVSTTYLLLEVTKVYEGDGTYNDLGVSEIELLVQTG